MEYAVQHITLDIEKSGSQAFVNIRKGDTARRVCITLTQGGRPYPANAGQVRAFISGLRPGAGNRSIKDETTIENGKILWDITAFDSDAVGTYPVWCRLYDTVNNPPKQLTSVSFSVRVDDHKVQENGSGVEPERSVLTQLIGEVNQAIEDMADSTITEAEISVGTGTGTPTANVSFEEASENGKKILFSFDGLKGEQGEQGEQGVRGPQGQKGDKGNTGATGERGPKGDKGEKGDQGEQGAQGVQGVSGVYVGSSTIPAGFNVKIDPSGDVDPIAAWLPSISENGDLSFSRSVSETPPATRNIRGPQGVQGSAGVDGADGYSPSATVERVTGGALITITDKDGTTTAEVYDGQGGGTSDHRSLSNRDAENQHPISAVTGLQTALDGKGTYSKPSSGIPKTDLAAAVQTSLGKADSALQAADIAGKQDTISDLATIRSGAAAGATAVQRVNNKSGTNITLVPADLGIGSVFQLKGSKPTVNDLPTSENAIGDVWYVVSESVGYIWLYDGLVNRWEQLGMEIDLSAYRTSAAQDLIDAGKLDKTGGAMSGPITLAGGDGKGIIMPTNANINTNGNQTILGFLSSVFTIGSNSYSTNIRGSGTRPKYKNADMALLSDVPDISAYRTAAAQDVIDAGKASSVTVNGETITQSGGNINIGTVLREHQDISGKADRPEIATELPGSGHTLAVNTQYFLGTQSAVSITLPTTGISVGDEILVVFTSGTTAAQLDCTPQIDFTPKANKTSWLKFTCYDATNGDWLVETKEG